MAVTITVAIGNLVRSVEFADEARATEVLIAYSELQGVAPDATPGRKLQSVLDGVVHHIRQDARGHRRQQALEAAIAAAQAVQVDFASTESK